MKHPEPLEIIIGDTITWKRRNVQAVSENDDGVPEYTDIKASESWTLKFTAVGRLGLFAITAAADDENADDFKFTATATVTAAYTAGDYQWQIIATYGSGASAIRYTIAEGQVTLLDNISVRTALYDNRSHAKKVLDAIEAILEGRASKDQESYSIAGRSLARTPIPDLLKLRSVYKNEYDGEVATARLRAGLASKRTIRTRFK